MSRDDGKLRFCESLVSGEGEAKLILSFVDIDEIIAIGTSNQYLTDQDSNQLQSPPKKMKLSEGIDLFVSETDQFSDFDFFRYRMSQFVEGVNIDTADFMDLVQEDRQAQIIHALKSMFGEDLSLALPMFVSVEGIQTKIEDLSKTMTDTENAWIKRYLFSKLNKQQRFTAKSNNSNIPISFVPITDDRDHKVLNRFRNLISELLLDNNRQIDLYVDLHGFSLEDSFVCMNALYAISADPKSTIRIKAVTDVTPILSGSLHEVTLSSNRYRVQKLMAGIHVFLHNGKTDILRDYWAESKKRNPGQKNTYLDQLLLAMSYVDAGISLCSIVELERGICGIRNLLNSPDAHAEVTDEGEALLLALKESIIRDYGPLLQGSGETLDSFELIKWAYRKKFYQQVITIIESRIPHELVRRGIFYPAAKECDKLAYIKAINYHYWDSLPKDRYIFKDAEHYFVKIYGRFAVDYKNRNVDQNTQYTQLRIAQVFGDSTAKNMLPAHSLIQDKELLTELLSTYYSLSAMRNTINHALVDRNASPEALVTESSVWGDVERIIGTFIDCYQRALDAVGSQKADMVPITVEELRTYFYAHGPKEDPDFRNVPGYSSFRDRNKRHDNGSGHRDNTKGKKHAPKNHPRGGKGKAPATKPEQPNINITLSLSQRKGAGGFYSQNTSNPVTINTGKKQKAGQGDIHIHIVID